MILFKACPRCGGDVDATYPEDTYCIQCSHRPQVAYPGPRVVQTESDRAASPHGGPGSSVARGRADGKPAPEPSRLAVQASTSTCPRCGSTELIRLDRLREEDNICYRCRPCGHIFSPATGEGERRREATAR